MIPDHTGFLAKAAVTDPATTLDRNQMISDGLSDVGKVLLGAGGAGIAYRLLQGLPDLFGRSKPTLVSDQAPALLEVPHPVYQTARDRGRLPAKRKKIPGAAGTSMQAVGVPFKQANDHAGTGGSPVADMLGLTKDPLDTSPSTPGQWLAGHGASPSSALGKFQIPWYTPALAIGGVGAGVAGYKGMDWLLNRKRKSDLNAELEDAKSEYQQALLDMYDPAQVKLLKKGAAGLGADLDRLALRVVGREKRADESWTDWVGRQAGGVMPENVGERLSNYASGLGGAGLGAYAALAGLVGLGTGVMSYQHNMQNNPSKALADAVKQRERQRWAQRPPEVFAVPVGVRRVGDRVESKDQPVASGV